MSNLNQPGEISRSACEACQKFQPSELRYCLFPSPYGLIPDFLAVHCKICGEVTGFPHSQVEKIHLARLGLEEAKRLLTSREEQVGE